MLSKRRRRAEVVPCSTLFRSLVVILIIGILAAIAIPSFLNQKSKATDASAKELARTAQTASETYATDHNGSYTSLSTTVLQGIEPTIQIASGNNNAFLSNAAATTTNVAGDGFTVTATSTSGNTFTIARDGNGTVTRSCTPTTTGASSGGC